jgi:tRNA-Thr(GGU) m(6)t(6)A37 methyltransferase TsaA
MLPWLLALGLACLSWTGVGYAQQTIKGTSELKKQESNAVTVNPIGIVERREERVFLQVAPQYAPALDGLTGFSHVWVLYWFHGHDNPEDRGTLKVHPRRDPANPLTGVFATRAPVRPNLIGLTACRLIGLKGTTLEVADLDAQDGSPVLDIKPYIPEGDSHPEAQTPEWVKRLKSSEK